MEIRSATHNDIEALIEFNQAMALETEGKNLPPDRLRLGVEAVFKDRNKGFYVVADSGTTIVGGLMVTSEWSDWRNAWFWWIQSVYVLPESRGQGIYRHLYEFVKRKASADENVCGFRLYVEKENMIARQVYEQMGMQHSHYLMYEEEK